MSVVRYEVTVARPSLSRAWSVSNLLKLAKKTLKRMFTNIWTTEGEMDVRSLKQKNHFFEEFLK